MLIGETNCIDDHFLCLLRLVVMSVLKSKERGEYIHIKGFEFVGQFFQGHGIPLFATTILHHKTSYQNPYTWLTSQIVDTKRTRFRYAAVLFPEERKFWKQYMKAYEECLRATSTRKSPWYVVPADDKDNTWLIISKIVLDTFEGLKMTYSKENAKHRHELLVIRKRLAKWDLDRVNPPIRKRSS